MNGACTQPSDVAWCSHFIAQFTVIALVTLVTVTQVHVMEYGMDDRVRLRCESAFRLVIWVRRFLGVDLLG